MPAQAGRERRRGAGQRGQHFDFSGFDFSDFASGRRGPAAGGGAGSEGGGGGGFRDIFSQFFGGRGETPQPEAEKGGDLEYVMNIDFWQAIKGTQARVNITRYEVCGTCHGSGSAGGGEVTCPQCKGTGTRQPDGRRDEIQPDLPASAAAPANCAMPVRRAAATAA